MAHGLERDTWEDDWTISLSWHVKRTEQLCSNWREMTITFCLDRLDRAGVEGSRLPAAESSRDAAVDCELLLTVERWRLMMRCWSWESSIAGELRRTAWSAAVSLSQDVGIWWPSCLLVRVSAVKLLQLCPSPVQLHVCAFEINHPQTLLTLSNIESGFELRLIKMFFNNLIHSPPSA